MATALPPHPMQPVHLDEHGTVRFRQNSIVRDLADAATNGRRLTLNDIAARSYTTEDVEQFWQLLGYSVSGYTGMDFVRPATAAHAEVLVDALLAAERIPSLADASNDPALHRVRTAMRALYDLANVDRALEVGLADTAWADVDRALVALTVERDVAVKRRQLLETERARLALMLQQMTKAMDEAAVLIGRDALAAHPRRES